MTITNVPAPLSDPYIYLLEISPYVPAVTSSVTIYLATQDYVSWPTDMPANQLYSGDLENSLLYSIDLFSSVSGGGMPDSAILSATRGGDTAGRGGIIVRNAGDQYDATSQVFPGPYDVWRQPNNMSYRFQGAPAVIYQGTSTQAKADMTVVWSGRAYDVVWDASGNQITIEMSSTLERLNKVFPLNTYAGTGGKEGGDDLKGKTKPVGLGRIREASPPLLNSLNIYQATDVSRGAAIDAFLGFFARGATIDAGPWTNAVTYTSLAAATVPIGKVYTCLQEGYFRLGSAPESPITCDFQVGNSTASTAAYIAGSIFSSFGGLTSADYSTASVAALATLQPAICGYWTGSDTAAPNMLDALDDVMGGIGAYYTETPAGLVTVGRLDAPTITGPDDAACALYIDMLNITEGTLTLRGSPMPPSQIVVNGHQFYTVQTSGLAGSLTNARIADLAQQWRTSASTPSGSVTQQWPLAQPVTVDSLMDVAADYSAEATRLATLYQRQRDIFSLSIAAPSLPVVLGDQVWLTHQRYSLQDGQAFVVVGIDQDAEKQTVTLTLWG